MSMLPYRRLIVIGLIIPALFSCAEVKKYEIIHPSMGVEFRVIFYEDQGINASDINDEVTQLIDKLNLVFSDYDVESEIRKLCDNYEVNVPQEVSNDLSKVLATAQEISKNSCGAFDVTVGPLSKLWRKAVRRNQVPDPKDIEVALSRVSHQNIELNTSNNSIIFKTEGVQLDFGGIAKGYTIDRIAEFFINHGINSFLIDGGGDIRVGNSPPGERGWKIKIINGDLRLLENVSVVSSGDKYKYVELNGNKYSHIVDPRTGIGITDRRTITVIGHSTMSADAWATALSIMSERERRQCIQGEELDEMEIIETPSSLLK
ncbi:MAG: FAD:protein FMN transferase [Saprospiraceae bacterium]|nr:FAD:protein FMN transferase [Saprospiraceae bacterium]